MDEQRTTVDRRDQRPPNRPARCRFNGPSILGSPDWLGWLGGDDGAKSYVWRKSHNGWIRDDAFLRTGDVARAGAGGRTYRRGGTLAGTEPDPAGGPQAARCQRGGSLPPLRQPASGPLGGPPPPRRATGATGPDRNTRGAGE